MSEGTSERRAQSAKDLVVYKTAYELAMQIFELSKAFPTKEKYTLTSQIRRSSRSICLNLREAWSKRRYPAHFVSKLTDCDGENAETDSSLDFARDCGYISSEKHAELTATCAKIGQMLGAMMKKSAEFVPKNSPTDDRPLPTDDGPPTTDYQPPTPYGAR